MNANQIGYAVGGTVAAPETALASSISGLEAYLTDLGMAAENLCGRLTPVMLPSNVAGIDSKGNQPLTASQSPTVERIGKATDRVRRITAQLQDAMNRLEA